MTKKKNTVLVVAIGIVLLAVLTFAACIKGRAPFGLWQIDCYICMGVLTAIACLHAFVSVYYHHEKKTLLLFLLFSVSGIAAVLTEMRTGTGYMIASEVALDFGLLAVYGFVTYKMRADVPVSKLLLIWTGLIVLSAAVMFVPEAYLPVAAGVRLFAEACILLYIINNSPEQKSRSPFYSALACLLFVTSSFAARLEQMGRGGYFGALYICVCIVLCSVIGYCLFLHSVIGNREVQLERAKMDLQLQEKEMSLMLSQIKPHFLYNTLNTIQYLCRTDPDLAAETIADFSDYLRVNMNALSNRKTILFSEELAHIKRYLKIEKLRFKHRLHVIYKVDDVDFYVPTLSVQPVVENAVKHGISQRLNGGTVTITAKQEEENFYIEVKDNGVGITPHKRAGHESMGLHNIRTRVKSLYGGWVTVESEKDRGTTVKIYLPIDTNHEITEADKDERSLY